MYVAAAARRTANAASAAISSLDMLLTSHRIGMSTEWGAWTGAAGGGMNG